jgi:hypothetical protein
MQRHERREESMQEFERRACRNMAILIIVKKSATKCLN